MPEEIKPNVNPRNEPTNVHDLESRKVLTNREISAKIRSQDKPPPQIGRRKKRFIETPAGKVAVVAATAIVGVGAYKMVGDAIDRQYGIGKYEHQKTTHEQVMDFRAGTIEGDKVLNGSIDIEIKTEDGEKLSVRSEPKVPDTVNGEKDNRIDWDQVMAVKTDQNSQEIFIKGKNAFTVRGQIKFITGYNPIGDTGKDGAYAALILIKADGTEQWGYMNSSPLTRSHLTTKGVLTDKNGNNPLTLPE